MTRYSTKLIEKTKIALAAIILMAIWGWGLVEYNNYMAKPAKEELYNQIPDIKLINGDTYLKERLRKSIETPTCVMQVGVSCFYSMQSYRSLLKSWFSFFSAADSLFSVSSVQASLSARSSLAI